MDWLGLQSEGMKIVFYFFTLAFPAFIICWAIFFLVLRDRGDVIERLFREGQVLQILTVLLVAVATTLLALVGIIESTGVSAILGGIVGYVLGTLRTKGLGS